MSSGTPCDLRRRRARQSTDSGGTEREDVGVGPAAFAGSDPCAKHQAECCLMVGYRQSRRRSRKHVACSVFDLCVVDDPAAPVRQQPGRITRESMSKALRCEME